MKKITVDGAQFVHGSSKGNYIRLNLKDEKEEIIKISKCKDNDEFIITGKQLKQLQCF